MLYRSIISLSILAVFSPGPACAKLGQDVSEFITKYKDQYKLRGTFTKDDATHYNFSLALEDSERQAAPGFGAGCTVTARQGLIVGQSMAICLGKDKFMGGQLAGAYGLKFACEAIGRTMPGDKSVQDRELEVFNKTTVDALSGVAKEIRYPGFDSKIILSRGDDGNLLIAVIKPEKLIPSTASIRPAFPPPAGKSPVSSLGPTSTGKPPVSKLVPPPIGRVPAAGLTRASKDKSSVSRVVQSPAGKTSASSPGVGKAPDPSLVPPPIGKTRPSAISEHKRFPQKQTSPIADIKNAIKQSAKD